MKLLSALDHSSRPRNRAGGRELDLDDLATRIDRDGLAAIAADDLVALSRRARLAGVHPAVVDLLTDTAAPPVVRARAYGLVHRRLTASPAGTDPVTAVAA